MSAFGDCRVFLEKYIDRPRHIEFQVFGDHHGNVLHLFERECSIQRRHQKIIEETPSPAMSEALRARMGEAAVKAARAAGYTNAGTVEFLLSDRGEFYFLEMNTRLQVEHPVTEMTTGLDLVRAQLIVADGQWLCFSQDSLRQRGHAIECRIYAEDASRGFLPSTGVIETWAPPYGPGIRVDGGVAGGSEVSVYYDPMLAKLIVCDETRADAMDKTIWALKRFAVLGVTTNIEFLHHVISHPAFRAGDIHTAFVEQHDLTTQMSERADDDALVAACVALLNGRPDAVHGPSASHAAAESGPWQRAGAWRSA
jgi:acetyl/propionyl-CoA carboxylase alpha subunit